MKRVLLGLVIVLLVASAVLGYFYYDSANRDFTPWMSQKDLTVYLKKFETEKNGQPNPWQKSHWITAAEGRWHDGIGEYRVRTGLITGQWEGYWFFDQDQDVFSKTLKYYGDEGFTLVYSNSYVRPDGTKAWQSVWHKTGAK